MAPQTVDYKAVIGDLEQKRSQMNARFDAAIAAIKQVLALEATGDQLNLPGVTLPRSAQSGPYRGLSMVQAAIKHLKMAGPVENVPLSKALEQGGFSHRSRNFPNTLNSVLRRRAKSFGDLRKTNRGWEFLQKTSPSRQTGPEAE